MEVARPGVGGGPVFRGLATFRLPQNLLPGLPVARAGEVDPQALIDDHGRDAVAVAVVAAADFGHGLGQQVAVVAEVRLGGQQFSPRPFVFGVRDRVGPRT